MVTYLEQGGVKTIAQLESVAADESELPLAINGIKSKGIDLIAAAYKEKLVRSYLPNPDSF